METQKLLMHMCCAPCANLPIDAVGEEGFGVTGFWFNPNIHPYKEYQSRKNTLVEYAQTIKMPLVVINDYGLRDFVRAVAQDIDGRCGHCYQCRMDETAKYAAEHGFDCFTTSLLISPYQNHQGIVQAAQEAAKRYGVDFLYRDFRPLFRAGQDRARALGFYMQKYCGCVFSEEDRYRKKKKVADPAGLSQGNTGI